MKLEDMPEPLSKREVEQICISNGLNLNEGNDKGGLHGRQTGELFELARKQHESIRKMQSREMVKHLHAAYEAIYRLFTDWHKDLIKHRHVGPKVLEEHITSQLPIRPNFHSKIREISPREKTHVALQTTLVQKLVQFGIGMPTDERSNSRARTSANQLERHGQSAPRVKNSRKNPLIGSKEPSQRQSLGGEKQKFAPLDPKKYKSDAYGLKSSRANQGKDKSWSESNVEEVDTEEDEYNRRGSDISSSDFIEKAEENDNSGYLEKFSINQKKIQSSHFKQERARVIENQFKRKMGGQASQDTIDKRNLSRSRANASADSLTNMMTEKELNDQKVFYLPQHMKMRKELIETRHKLSNAERQLDHAEQRNRKMISKIRQEEVARAVHSKILSLPYPEQASTIKDQIEARFVNVADGLEPHVMEILNQKLIQIKDFFISQIQLISHHTDCLRQNIALMESMNKDGLKFNEMDTKTLIEKMAEVEEIKRDQNAQLRILDPTSKGNPDMNRPLVIWNLLQSHFGQDYFLEVIEEEYGISPGANKQFETQINNHFESTVMAFTVDQHNSEKHHEEQMNMLREKISDLTMENTRLMRQDQKALDRIQQELRANINMLAKNQEEVLIKSYKQKLRASNEAVAQLHEEAVKKHVNQKHMQQEYWFKRLQMFVIIQKIIRNIKQENRTKIDEKMLATIEKFIKREYIIVRYTEENDDVPPSLAYLYKKIDSLAKWKKKWEISEDQYGYFSNRTSELNMQVEAYRAEIESLKAENIALQSRLPSLEEQVESLEQILLHKEQECKALNEKVKTIENRWKNNTKEAYKFTGKTILAALELKSLNEMSAHRLRGVTSMMRNCRYPRDKGTITKICDLREQVDFIRLKEPKHMDHADTQTNPVEMYDHLHKEGFVKERIVGAVTQTHHKRCGDYNIRLISQGTQSEVRAVDPIPLLATQKSNATEVVVNMTTTRRTQAKPGVSKPQMKKAQSGVLAQTEFVFNSSSVQPQPIPKNNNTSILKHRNMEETRSQQTSVHDSAGKNNNFTRRTTLHNIKDSASRIKSNNEKLNINRIKSKSGASDRSHSRDRSSQRLQKQHTTEFIGAGLAYKEDNIMTQSMASLPSRLEEKNPSHGKSRALRQTTVGASVSVKSKNSSSNFLTHGDGKQANLRKTHRDLAKDSDLANIGKRSTSQLKGAHHNSQIAKSGNQTLNNQVKSPEKLNTSHAVPSSMKQNQSKRKTTVPSKDKLHQPSTRKARENMSRQTSAQRSKRLNVDQKDHGQYLRASITKYNSKRDVYNNKSLLQGKANQNTSKLSMNKTSKASNMQAHGMDRDKNSRAILSESNQDMGISEAGINYEIYRSHPQNIEDGFTSDNNTQNMHYPAIGVNSSDGAISPVNINASNIKRDDQLSAVQPKERKLASSQFIKLPADFSPGMMNEKVEIGSGTVINGPSQGKVEPKPEDLQAYQEEENLMLSKHLSNTTANKKPTTVRDTSKDYSQSSKHNMEPSHFMKHQVQAVALSNEDYYSTNSEGEKLSPDKFKHLRNLSNPPQKTPADLSSEFMGTNADNIVDSSGKKNVRLVHGLGSEVKNPASRDIMQEKRLTQVKERKDEDRVVESSSRLSKTSRSIKDRSKSHQSRISEQSSRSVQEFCQDVVNQVYQAPQKSDRDEMQIEERNSQDKINLKQDQYLTFSQGRNKTTTGASFNKYQKQTPSKANGVQRNSQTHQIDPIDRSSAALMLKSNPRSFDSDDDSSDYSVDLKTGKRSKRSKKTTTVGRKTGASRHTHIKEVSIEASPLRQVVQQFEEEKQESQAKEKEKERAQRRIIKLREKNYINEAQFLCLILLEQGYMPSRSNHFENDKHQSNRNSQRTFGNQIEEIGRTSTHSVHEHDVKNSQTFKSLGSNQPLAQTVSSGWYSRPSKNVYSSSNSRSPQTARSPRISKNFIENTYRIYPNKPHVLQKILDRVYANKRSMGTQYEMIASVECSDEGNANTERGPYDWNAEAEVAESGTASHRARISPPNYMSMQPNSQAKKLKRVNQAGTSLKISTSAKNRGHISNRLTGAKTSHAASSLQFTGMRGLGATMTPNSNYLHPSLVSSTNRGIETIGSNILPRISTLNNKLPTAGGKSGMLNSAENLAEVNASASQRWIGSMEYEAVEPSSGQTMHMHDKHLPSRKIKLKKPMVNKALQNLARESMELRPDKQTAQGMQRTVYSPPEALTNQNLDSARKSKKPHNLIVTKKIGTGASATTALSGRYTSQSNRGPDFIRNQPMSNGQRPQRSSEVYSSIQSHHQIANLRLGTAPAGAKSQMNFPKS